MFIARKLKDENIAEYLLYMWQVEDIIRAAGLDLDRLSVQYLDRFGVSGKDKDELQEWYGNLIEMMRSENVRESGHLQINKNIILTLTELHLQLLTSPKFPFYSAAYYKALPYIVELRNKGGKKDVSEIENCFDALYGVMLLKLQNKPVSEETTKALADITKLLGMLSEYYKQDKAGTLKFE